MAELVDDLTNDQRYGVPIPPPFWLFGVCVRLSGSINFAAFDPTSHLPKVLPSASL